MKVKLKGMDNMKRFISAVVLVLMFCVPALCTQINFNKKQGQLLTLDYPNREVLDSLPTMYLKLVYKVEGYAMLGNEIWKALREGDISEVVSLYEFWYRSMFVMLLRGAGIISYSEPHTSFEACNILRGSINQDEYKSYVTPILFFKRISDVYDEEIQTALEESNGDKEYAFFPENHRCGELGTSAYAAAELLTGEEFEGVSGKYFSMSTEPAKSSKLSYSVEDAREFWEESEKLSVLRRK